MSTIKDDAELTRRRVLQGAGGLIAAAALPSVASALPGGQGAPAPRAADLTGRLARYMVEARDRMTCVRFGPSSRSRDDGAWDRGGRRPPVVTASRICVAIGVGTGAHRVSAYNPLTALQWLLDGRTAGGARTACRSSRLVAFGHS
jgi:hypothetical protein